MKKWLILNLRISMQNLVEKALGHSLPISWSKLICFESDAYSNKSVCRADTKIVNIFCHQIKGPSSMEDCFNSYLHFLIKSLIFHSQRRNWRQVGHETQIKFSSVHFSNNFILIAIRFSRGRRRHKKWKSGGWTKIERGGRVQQFTFICLFH